MYAYTLQQPIGLEQLKPSEHPTPKPQRNQILVNWKATSLNFHDYMVATGKIPVQEGMIPMSDGAGTVVEVGPDVTLWKAGDSVMSLFFPNWHTGTATRDKTSAINGETHPGCATQYQVLPETAVTRMPNGYSFEQAATLPCAAVTAWRALMVEGNLQAGESVLVEGSGGVSIFAMQLAKAAGAAVFATSSSQIKADRLKVLGATATVNYKDDERWGRTLYKMTGGIDHVLDVGGGSTFRQSVEAAKIGGHIYSFGILGSPKGEVLFTKLFFKQLRVSGIAVGSREMQEEMIRALEVNQIAPIIDKVFGLEELGAAFKHQESGKHFGKIVVRLE